MPTSKFKPLSLLSRETIRRFWDHVTICGPDECWPWHGCRTPYGYGTMRSSEPNASWLAHRIAYYLQYGIDPGDKCVCHSCDYPPCLNGRHLFLGTKADNNTDRHKKGRSKMPTNRSRGDKNARAKLNDEKVRSIRNLFAVGSRVSALAKYFGVSKQSIHSIVKNKYWHHVK